MSEDFLNDLDNTVFKEPLKAPTAEEKRLDRERTKEMKMIEKQRIKEEKERLKLEAKLMKHIPRENIHMKIVEKGDESDNDSVFAEKGSVILGKEKRELLVKIRQYKELFKTELKGFKVKKDASVKELNEYLVEFESIVNTSNMDSFLIEGILSSIKVVEGVSSYTKNYDVTGLADLLKNNKQFHNLSKQLFLKYSLFGSTPPEYQMLLLVATTAYIAKQKNLKRTEIEAFLNEPISANK